MRRLTVLLLSLLFSAAPGHALWKSFKTSAFILFYPEEREEQALEVLGILEGTRSYVEQTLGHPARRIAVVLTDVGIESNGLTDPVFRRILLYPYSPSEGALGTLESWWRLLWVHELSHWVHLDMAAGVPKGLKALFGNVLAPNLFAPAWLLEGVCVYAESGSSPFEGRLNDGTFAAYTATLAREDALPSLAAATFQSSEFPAGTGPYLYGGVFVGYLADTYGEEAVREFLHGTSSSVLSYLSPLLPAVGLDRSARRAFGRPFRTLWREWQDSERLRAADFRTPATPLAGRPGWIEAPVAWGKKLYSRRTRPLDSRPLETRRVHEIVRLDPDSGREEVLVRSTAGFTGPLVVREGALYYALLELDRGYANTELGSYGFTARVWELDLTTSKRRRLCRAPLRSFAVLEDGNLLCSLDRRQAFGSELALFQRESGQLRSLFETELLVAEIQSGPAGVFVSARRDGENFGVYRVRAAANGRLPASRGSQPGTELTGEALCAALSEPLSPADLSLEPLLPAPFREAQLCLAGERLYFAANPEGRYRIYARDLESGRTAVCEDLGFQCAPAFDPDTRRLYALSLVPEGYTLCELPDPLGEGGGDQAAEGAASVQAGEVRWRPPPPPPEDQIRRGGYLDNLGTLLPRALLPLFAFDSSTYDVQAGAALLGMSALGDLQYYLSLFYDSGSGKAEVEAALQVKPAFPLEAELSFTTMGTNSLALTLLSPLFRGLAPGLSYVMPGATARLFEADFSRFEIAPSLALGLRGPFTELQLSLQLPVESSSFGSDRDSLALVGALELVQLLGPLQLGFEAVGVRSFDGSYWRLPAPPAYTEGLAAVLGAAARLDLWIPLLRVRRGLWNPGLYLEDLYLAAFGEAALNESLALQLSYGGEVHLELRALAAATGVPADLFVRVAVPREGQPGVTVGLETAGLDNYIRSMRKGVAR